MKKNKLKFKSIELAPTAGIDVYEDLAQEVVKKCCGVKGGALVTDETELTDFDFRIGKDKNGKLKVTHETEKTLAKVKKIYGIDVSGIKNLNLLEICKYISATRCQ